MRMVGWIIRSRRKGKGKEFGNFSFGTIHMAHTQCNADSNLTHFTRSILRVECVLFVYVCFRLFLSIAIILVLYIHTNLQRFHHYLFLESHQQNSVCSWMHFIIIIKWNVKRYLHFISFTSI